MKRQTINIGNLEYICELYSAEKDYSPIVYKEFVILRNLDFINNIACDKDIYFLDKSIYEQIRNSNSEVTNLAVFPYNDSNFGSFSTNYTDFISILNNETFKLETEGGNVFSLYKSVDGNYTNKNVKIKCDKLRIYHPHNKTNLDYIIYLDNIINGIHFHYLCNYNSNYETHSETEFKVHNNIYSEFIEVYIPSINELFTRHEIVTEEIPEKYIDNYGIIRINVKTKYFDNNIYFNDFYNVTKYIDEYKSTYKKESSWISMKDSGKSLFDDVDLLSMVPLYLILNPYIINTNDDGIEEKIYFRLTDIECNNYNTFPINITLYPYLLSDVNNVLLLNDNYPPNSDVFIRDYYFKLVSNIGFSNGTICVTNKFLFNNKYDKYTNPNGISTQEGYAKYNGLDIEQDENGKWHCPLYEQWYDYSKLSYNDLKEKLNTTNSEEEKEKIERLIELQEDGFDTDEFDETCLIKCCGYQIDIATDFKFKNIIATDYQEMPFIDDFDFSLLHLFTDWYSVPKTLIIRIKFIDKYLGVVINTGNILLTKELIKYCINNTNTTRLFTDILEKQNNLSNMSWSKINAENSTFTFIDKIHCIIDKTENNTTINGNTQSTRVIYKPVFYKTQDLQTIRLSSGFNQKIGINLSQYMTKVSIFKMIIGGLEISEYGRNDIYVIFEINSSNLSSSTGKYSIVDYDNNYISSGTYIVD